MATDREETALADRRRVLVCMPFTPRLDARHGGKATSQLLLRLATQNDVAVLCLRAPDEGPIDAAIASRCAHVEEVPFPGDGGGGMSPWRRRIRWALGLARGLPPWAADSRSEVFRERLSALAAEWRPDVVELHHQVLAQYVGALAAHAVPTILVEYDPPSAWAAELLKGGRGPRWLIRRAEVTAWRRYERATRPAFQAIVVFAERDHADVAPTAGGVPVVTIPLGIEIPPTPLDPVGAPPPTVLFVGGFRHPPNVDAARWLAELFPRVVDAVPDACLQLVGHAPNDEVRRLAGGPVTVHGSVPDVTPYLDRAAVVAAPLRLGGSMRMKMLEALAAGKAVVASPRAAAGIDATPGEDFVLVASGDELVSAIAGLLGDERRRRTIAANARRWAEANLGWQRSLAAFERLYDSLGGRSCDHG